MNLKFLDENLIDALALHLTPAYYRVKYGLSIRNPLLEEMKERYSEVFDAATKACHIFSARTGLNLPEEEIAYVAMHVGAALERATKRELRKKKIALICASGMGTANLLAAQIESRFPLAQITGTYSVMELEEALASDVDAIISTIPISIKALPCAVVNPILQFKDIRIIEDLLNLIPYTSQEGFSDAIGELRLNRENIRFNVNCQDWVSGVREAGTVLFDQGFCEKRYVDAMVRQIETYGSYVVLQGGIAIPHATPQDGVIKPGISLIRLEHPVKFPGHPDDVWTIMGLALTWPIGPKEIGPLKDYLFNGNPKATAEAKTFKELVNSLRSIIQ